MSGLAVKVDQVAALRAVRKSQIPDPVTAAAVADLAGADGIIVHLYQNRRHIKDRDYAVWSRPNLSWKWRQLLKWLASPLI